MADPLGELTQFTQWMQSSTFGPSQFSTAYTMTATHHDGHNHDIHKPWPWWPQRWKREKLMPNIQLSSFNIVRQISPSCLSWSVAIIVCGHHCLWPSWSVAVMVCGHHGLWPLWSVAIMVCGRHGLWPSWSVAVIVELRATDSCWTRTASPFIIAQPKSFYLLYHPMEGRRLSRLEWLVKCSDCLPACRQSPIHITRSSI